MNVDLLAYQERKPRRVRFILWRIVNDIFFRLITNGVRKPIMRLCCAHYSPGHVYGSVKIYMPWNLSVGPAVCIGPKVEIYNKAMVTIGKNVVISQGAYLCTASHDISSPTMDLVVKSIVIGDNVWIAAHATILPGVTIGEGAVVGACAVVAKDVPPWSVVVGNPAQVVKQRTLKNRDE